MIPKYKLGDVVFFVYKNNTGKAKVVGVTHLRNDAGLDKVWYYLYRFPGAQTFNEDELHPTFDALIEHFRNTQENYL